MLTLFAESPIIFMGYSFTDENIQCIIEEFLSCLTPKELKNISNHFVFVSYKKGERRLVEKKRTLFTVNKVSIPITEIETDNYNAVYDKLNKILPGISASRIRATRKIVKRIVDESVSSDAAESIIVGIDDLDSVDISNKPLAIAIGYRDNILNKIGYGMVEVETIMEDILYNNKHLDPERMCLDRFKSISSTLLIPVFKYVKDCPVEIPKESKLYKYIAAHETINKIISKSQLKAIGSLPKLESKENIHDIINAQITFDKKAGVLLKNIALLTADEIRHECKFLFEEASGTKISSTCFKRCVMYLDYIENYKEKS